MPYGNLNVDTVTTSTAGGILGAGNASIMKNRILNGGMVIDQRNAGAAYTPTANGYSLDRWYYELSQASKFSGQQNQGSVTPPAGFTNYLGTTTTSAVTVGSGEYFLLTQAIEGFNLADLGWGTANAKTVTLSFQVYSSLTGTFGGSINNNAQNRTYPFSYTVSSANTWTSISVTIAGDTSGTWLTTNGIGARVRFGLGVGTTYSGTAGAWTSSLVFAPTGAVSVVGTNGATFYITGVQLEVGSNATGFEYRTYNTELANCQRYCYRYCGSAAYESSGLNGNATSATRIYATFNCPTQMRATPTISYSNLRIDDWTNGYALTAMGIDSSSSGKVVIAYADIGTSSLTQYRVYSIIANNTTSAYSILSAEL